jgi:hypothetical protein
MELGTMGWALECICRAKAVLWTIRREVNGGGQWSLLMTSVSTVFGERRRQIRNDSVGEMKRRWRRVKPLAWRMAHVLGAAAVAGVGSRWHSAIEEDDGQCWAGNGPNCRRRLGRCRNKNKRSKGNRTGLPMGHGPKLNLFRWEKIEKLFKISFQQNWISIQI